MESFPKSFMVTAGYSYNGKLTIRRVHKNVKVNSAYYQTNVLTPIFRTQIPALYGADSNKVWLHQNKASSHKSASIRHFWRIWSMERETGIHCIPVKSSDASSMDFCAFGLLKRALKVEDQELWVVSGKPARRSGIKWTPVFFAPACCSGNSDAER